MSKRRSENPAPFPKSASKAWFAVAVIVIGAVISLAVSKRRPASSASPPAASTSNSTPAVAPAAVANLQSVKGRWLRPDGGYVLEIRKVDDNGQLDAGYFNPNPIRITSAVAKKDGGATKVLIELNDVNYPGCKYNLTFIPDKDVLVGTYYQAAMNETFEVAFEREK